jgi:septal ring-binding cell division protein DamX
MNHTHLPRPLVIVLFILVVGFFFIGTLRAFIPAYAVSNATVSPAATLVLNTPSATPAEPENETLGSAPAATNTGQAGSEEGFTPTPTPTPTPIDNTVYADTTGIIALATLMVVVILVGMAWGGRHPRKKKEPKE